MHDEEHVRVNRDGWDRAADEYQQRHERQIGGQALTGDIAWGLWAIPESTLRVLGDVEGRTCSRWDAVGASGRWLWRGGALGPSASTCPDASSSTLAA